MTTAVCPGHRLQSRTASKTTPNWCARCQMWFGALDHTMMLVPDEVLMPFDALLPSEDDDGSAAEIARLKEERDRALAASAEWAARSGMHMRERDEARAKLVIALDERNAARRERDEARAVAEETMGHLDEARAENESRIERLKQLGHELEQHRAEIAQLRSEVQAAHRSWQSDVARLTDEKSVTLGQFNKQRDNYMELLRAIYGGRLPDFEYDPFRDVAKMRAERDALRGRVEALEFPLFQWREWVRDELKPYDLGGPDHALVTAIDAYRTQAEPVSKESDSE